MIQTIETDYDFTFVRAGKKNDNTYLILSNGRKEIFATLGKGLSLDDFSRYEENDPINLRVSLLPGADRVTVTAVND